MLVSTNIAEAVGSLYAAKGRTALSLICITIGIGSVIAMITVGGIVKRESVANFKQLGTDVFRIQKLRSPGRAEILPSHVADMPARIPSVAAAAPWVSTSGRFAYRGRRIGQSTRILGVTEAYANIQKLGIADGRAISDLDVRRRYCVIGDALAAAMRGAGANPVVGERIKAGGHVYTVVGVLEPGSRRRGLDPNHAVLVPLSTAQRAFKDSTIRQILGRMHPNADHRRMEKEVTAYFRTVSANLRLSVRSEAQLIAQVQTQLRLITLLLAAVGAIALIIGGANIMNVMLASVAERRSEIGLRRALGARRSDIRNQFLIESVTLSLFGSVLGIGVGLGCTYALCLYSGWTYATAPGAVALGVGVASGVGVAFGLYPAWQAARLDPIAAMRAL